MTLTMEPQAFLASFTENFNSGELDRVASGYTSDAVLNLGAGAVLRGPEQIRGALQNFLAPKLPMVVTLLSQTTSGDTSVVIFDWRITGNSPDGSPVDLGGTAVDVIRKGADGVWRQLLDLPFGSATAQQGQP